MKNRDIASRLYRMAAIMELRGEDPFRWRSYRNAAEAIESWSIPMEVIKGNEGVKGLQSVPGVGKAISSAIIELLETGTFNAWEHAISETPESVLDLLKVEGIGGKIASTLFHQFKIASLEDLKEFIQGGGLELVDGVGARTAKRIQTSLTRLNRP